MSEPPFARSATFLTAVAVLSAAAFVAHARADDTEFRDSFDLSTEAAFADYRKAVTKYLGERRAKVPADVCVIGLRAEDGFKHAWVLWPQGRQIILWEGDGSDLRTSRRRLRIPADVVNTEKDLKGSTYLVTRAWVKDLTRACDERGTKVRVQRKKH
jgi:hypothetical protein